MDPRWGRVIHQTLPSLPSLAPPIQEGSGNQTRKYVRLVLCHSSSTTGIKLLLVVNTVSAVLHQYQVNAFYYEESLLFHTVFSSESCLKNFILAIGEVKSALEPQLQSLFLLERGSPRQLTVEVQPDLFLVSPNQQKTKGVELNLVTMENYSTFMIRWKDSKLFDFGSLCQEKGMHWCINLFRTCTPCILQCSHGMYVEDPWILPVSKLQIY